MLAFLPSTEQTFVHSETQTVKIGIGRLGNLILWPRPSLSLTLFPLYRKLHAHGASPANHLA
jgi:hypothetical protein